LQYGLGQQEASDYSLRDAFRDVAFAAAGNAIFHTGIGTAGELLRGRPEVSAEVSTAAPLEFREAEVAPTAAPPPRLYLKRITAEAAPILSADAQTQHAAMASAVSELADGRPVQVDPFFPSQNLSLRGVSSEELQARDEPPLGRGEEYHDILDREGNRQGFIVSSRQGDTATVHMIARGLPDDVYGRDDLGGGANAFGPSELRGLLRQYIQQNPEIKQIVGLRVSGARAEAGALPRAAITINRPPSEVAAQQRALYHDGFAPGVLGDELRLATDDIYAPQEPETEELGGTPATPREESAPSVPEQQEPRPAEPKAEGAEADPELMAAQRRMDALGEGLLPEERDEITRVRQGLEVAETKAAAIEEAANCLKEAGL
jgi:hypothetical protein